MFQRIITSKSPRAGAPCMGVSRKTCNQNKTQIKPHLRKIMSITVHYAQIKEPDLLDIVDDEWQQDTLPADGARNSRLKNQCAKRRPIVFLAICGSALSATAGRKAFVAL